MANWLRPVFDRTQADVDYARQQLSTEINDVEYKGAFNMTDINRIETNTRYLADTLNELYYTNSVSTKSNWKIAEIVDVAQVSRVINNIDTLLKEYHKSPVADNLPSTILTYEQANNIERNLYLIKEMIDDMVNSFNECGTFNCGEV